MEEHLALTTVLLDVIVSNKELVELVISLKNAVLSFLTARDVAVISVQTTNWVAFPQIIYSVKLYQLLSPTCLEL